jgi:GTPase SAR1 family protein
MSSGPYNYSYIFKYIIIGDMGVGKSCLLHQFTEKKCKIEQKVDSFLVYGMVYCKDTYIDFGQYSSYG